MPGLPAGHGDGSPKLHTVLVWPALVSVFVLRSSIKAGRPVFPTVASVGNDGTALAPTPACATAGASIRQATAATAATPHGGQIPVSIAPSRRTEPSIPLPRSRRIVANGADPTRNHRQPCSFSFRSLPAPRCTR